jgi:branched-chain amino acid transport system permease protein
VDFLFQLTINGIVAGGIFALMGVGFSLIYSTSRIFHIAHGGIFIVSAYAFFALTKLAHIPVVISAPLAVGVAVLLGLIVELFGYRPLRRRGASLATFMIGSFALLIILQNLMILIFGTQPKMIREAPLPSWGLAGARITYLHLAILIACALIFSGLQIFFARAKTGKIIRAMADNPELAATVGIDTQKLYFLIMALGSGLAGVAAVFVGLDIGVTMEYGFYVVLIAAVAAIIGGVGHFLGTGLAALLLGLIQNWSIMGLSPQWQEAVAFGVFIIFLIFLPQGLFGAKLATRRS